MKNLIRTFFALALVASATAQAAIITPTPVTPALIIGYTKVATLNVSNGFVSGTFSAMFWQTKMLYNESSGEWYGGAGSVSFPYTFIESESPLPNSDGSGILARVFFDATAGSTSTTPKQYKVKINYSATGGCEADEIATNAYYMDELVYNVRSSSWHETKTAACSESGSLTTNAINVFSVSRADETMYDNGGDSVVDFWFQGGDGSVEKSTDEYLGAGNQRSGIDSIVIYKKN